MNTKTNSNKLNQFTKMTVLKDIGRYRLSRFFDGFHSELTAAQIAWPRYDAKDYDYFRAVADLLTRPGFPKEPLFALNRLEILAAHKNWKLLNQALPFQPFPCPGPSVNRALEVWFRSPQTVIELTDPLASDDGGSITGSAPSPIEIRNSKFENAQPGLDAGHSTLGSASSPDSSIAAPTRRVVASSQTEASGADTLSASNGDHNSRSESLSSGNIIVAGLGPHSATRTSLMGRQIRGGVGNETHWDKGRGVDDSVNSNFAHSQSSGDDSAFLRLAQLTPAQYDRVREREARLLCVRIKTLDAEVSRRREKLHHTAASNSHPSTLNDELSTVLATLHTPEPWPEPVDAAETLHQVAARYSTYIFLPPGAAHAIALWTAHAHAFEAFRLSPRLNLQSPEPGCGKTTALDVIASMVPRAVRTENLTAPVLFRLVDQYQPTMLLDEVDSYLPQAEELRGLLNAGHKRGACAYRCAGEGNSLRAFKAFAPAVLSGIGTLPGTLHDRSVHIPLVKAQPGEIATLFDEEHIDLERTLSRKLARWARDNFEALKDCASRILRPNSGSETLALSLQLQPSALPCNRLADNWRPLFAIAHLAGGEWPKLAADAFAQLTARDYLDAHSLGISLLQDIRDIFIVPGRGRISSRQLVDLLCSLADRPWHEAHKRKPINETWLGRRLSAYGISPSTIRIGDRQLKGYDAADFQDVFARFLPGNLGSRET